MTKHCHQVTEVDLEVFWWKTQASNLSCTWMNICVCVYVCICIYGCVCVCMCICIHVYIYCNLKKILTLREDIAIVKFLVTIIHCVIFDHLFYKSLGLYSYEFSQTAW